MDRVCIVWEVNNHTTDVDFSLDNLEGVILALNTLRNLANNGAENIQTYFYSED